MNNPKCRSRALQIVVGQQGQDVNQIVVMGNGIDSVILAKKLRKKIGYTEIVSISSRGASRRRPWTNTVFMGCPTQCTNKKMVLGVDMNNQKHRSKALQIVVGQQGVISASLAGEDMNQIVVVGNGIDSIILTKKLRKKIGYTEIVSISPEEKDKKEKEKEAAGQIPHMWAVQPSAPMYVYQAPDPATPTCGIM